MRYSLHINVSSAFLFAFGGMICDFRIIGVTGTLRACDQQTGPDACPTPAGFRETPPLEAQAIKGVHRDDMLPRYSRYTGSRTQNGHGTTAGMPPVTHRLPSKSAIASRSMATNLRTHDSMEYSSRVCSA